MNKGVTKDSMRKAFWGRIYEIAKKDRNVMVVSADMSVPALDDFQRDLPGQFVNTGIAEANAILVSAGLALEGKKVFVYAIAPFITLRCYEQIKIELAAMKIPVTIVGEGAGFSYADSGPTHHTLEDVSIMRVLPNMTVHTMTDSIMAIAFADISCKMKESNYLRLDREALPNVYKEGKEDFSSGYITLKKGYDVCIVASGNMVYRALEVAEELEKKKDGMSVGVIDLHTLPFHYFYMAGFLESLERAKKIVTLEEHFLAGGMGSAVLEMLMDMGKHIPVKRIGVDNKKGYCYSYGGREHIQSLHGLDKASIVDSILSF